MQSACKYSHDVPERGLIPPATQLEPAELDVPSSMDPSEDYAISEPLTSPIVHLYNVS